ncbi:hypothetical protein [Methylobacterium soli]|uniref:Uncharacterized protein n=1 Tax=Methylobacterium soli TaxID=553447 RepID=A0A6L3SRV5_9HYPH|nr:hypothetical protein [Methylobacterium soli]KAB1072237.1 hypothetical protein F6X53_28445 [Methylobacterium soli]GJE45311.1 hypothetical protein AEGHOMDF_4505 [Methylobacterium soli]
MAGATEDRLDALNDLIEEGEQHRAEQAALVATQALCGRDAAAAEAELREIDDALTALRMRVATFAGNPRHS